MEKSESYKIALMGMECVGKSAITVQFVQKVFVEEYEPTIDDLYRKYFTLDGKKCFLEINDTAGSEGLLLHIVISSVEHKVLWDLCIQHAHGFLIVFDITDRKSFEALDEYVQKILRMKKCDSVPMVLVGNKCDLKSERSVNRDSIEMYAMNKLWKVPYFEVSAKDRIGIDECFTELVRLIRKTSKTSKQ